MLPATPGAWEKYQRLSTQKKAEISQGIDDILPEMGVPVIRLYAEDNRPPDTTLEGGE